MKGGKKPPKADKPKRTYNKRKAAGEKTKRIRKDSKANPKKRGREKKEGPKYNQFNISSITEDMIQNMQSYLHQEFRKNQEKKRTMQKSPNQSIGQPQQNDFSSYFKKYNYTFANMNAKKSD